MTVWQAISAVLVAIIPAVVGLIRGRRAASLDQRLRRHHELAVLVAENVRARTALDELVATEAEALLRRDGQRLQRQLNPTNVILAILLTVVSAGVIYGLISAVVANWGTVFGGILTAILAIVAAFAMLITGAGFATIYTPSRPRAPKTKKK